jgi:hypothetical protein
MLSIVAWLGNLPASFSRLAPNQASVYAKLNNKFLGVVVNPFAQGVGTFASSYDAMRDLQDQVALLLKHEYLPPRYLVLYVGDVRLTQPDFPFVNNLDLDDQAHVRSVLKDAQSISVMYFIDQSCAEASLKARNLIAGFRTSTLHVDRRTTLREVTQPTLALPELDVWAFGGSVHNIVFHFKAIKLGSLEYFPHLRYLEMFKPCEVAEVDFKSLATTCKMIQRLYVRLEASQSALDGLGELRNLTDLGMEILTPKNTLCFLTIPTEVGKLVKLTRMRICGNVYGFIPKEIGQLTDLTSLSLHGTHLSGFLPTELGLLTNLKFLNLKHNQELCGSIPRTLRTPTFLSGTPNVQPPWL